MLPEVPVTVTVVNPVAADDAAVNCIFRVVPVCWIEALTPFGRLDRLSFTAPSKPPKSVMVIAALAFEL